MDLAWHTFLGWIGAQAKGVWCSPCPSLFIWQDALPEALVRVDPGPDGMTGALVR